MGKIEQIRQTIADPFGSNDQLRESERRVLTLASHGLTNRQIAGRLGMSDENVAYFLRNGLMKIDMKKKQLPYHLIQTIEEIVG